MDWIDGITLDLLKKRIINLKHQFIEEYGNPPRSLILSRYYIKLLKEGGCMDHGIPRAGRFELQSFRNMLINSSEIPGKIEVI